MGHLDHPPIPPVGAHKIQNITAILFVFSFPLDTRLLCNCGMIYSRLNHFSLVPVIVQQDFCPPSRPATTTPRCRATTAQTTQTTMTSEEEEETVIQREVRSCRAGRHNFTREGQNDIIVSRDGVKMAS